MKNTCTIKKLSTLLALVALAIIAISSTAAKAATTGKAEDYIQTAADYGIIESQTVEEFKPNKAATYSFAIDLIYSIRVLRENGGFPVAKNHSWKKESSWMKEVFWQAALKNPEDSTALLLGFTHGKGRSPKKSDKVTYEWLKVLCDVTLNGKISTSRDDLATEVKARWNGGKNVSRMEALDYISSKLIADLGLGTPLPPEPETQEMVGTAIMMDEHGDVYEDGKYIGRYVDGTIIMIGEPPIAVEEEFTSIGEPPIAIEELTLIGEPPIAPEEVTLIGEPPIGE